MCLRAYLTFSGTFAAGFCSVEISRYRPLYLELLPSSICPSSRVRLSAIGIDFRPTATALGLDLEDF